ncbi:MAG: macro domain-containing protein [Bacteroidota bacterium]
MIKYTKGNIIQADAEAIVNTVNTVGVMGKGIALAFKKAFPDNFKIYKKLCDEKKFDVGDLLITDTGQIGPKLIINFPTKKHWRSKSKMEYIEIGMKVLIKEIVQRNIKSIAIPPLGCGNGGLDWEKVKSLILSELAPIEDQIIATIYEPGYNDQFISVK